MSSVNGSQRLEWIQALRGVAALLVVLTHTYYFLEPTSYGSVAKTILAPGAMGVDIFFLISGFIMAISIGDKGGSIYYSVNFLIKRFLRIWPLYAITTAIMVLIARSEGYLKHTDNLLVVLKSLLLLPVDTLNPPYLGLAYGLGWTLSYELYFYVVLSACLLMDSKRWIGFYGWMGATIVALPVAALGMFSLRAENSYGFRIDFINEITNPIILIFVFGFAVGRLYMRDVRLPDGRWSESVVPLTIICAAILIYSGVCTSHGFAGWGAPLAVAFMLAVLSRKTETYRIAKQAIWLGEISYSLYLTHRITQVLCSKAAAALGYEGLIHTVAFVAVSTVVAIAVAAATYYTMEKPIVAIAHRLTRENKYRKEQALMHKLP